MLSSLVFKEWLKVKWVFIGLAIIHGILLISVYYDLSNMFKDYRANEIIGSFISLEIVFYANLKYVVLLTGTMIGVFQYFPELNQSRLKLTLHLPVRENLLIFQMAMTGVGLLVILDLADTLLLSLMSWKFLPWEFFASMITTTLPWYLGGLCAYFWVMTVFIEPSWMKRILLVCVGTGMVSLFFVGGGFSPYGSSLWYFSALAVLSGAIIFLSAYNFKRGIV